MINCLNLDKQLIDIKDEIFEKINKVYDDSAFSGGKYVEEFEQKFAKYCGTDYSVGVSNGTTALHLAMLVNNIGIGDEVIIPANTFIATAWGVSHAGATPVFVDCTSDTWQIDATKIEAAITPKTKGVIGVHLYGQPFDYDAVRAICDKHNIILIEDAAQAQGSKYKGKMCGSLSDLATFSFYPGKNLGAIGEAGGLTTNDKNIYNHLLSLRNHGMKTRYYHDEIGYNYRMGGIEGASLIVKLQYLDLWNNKRRKIASRYFTEITNDKITMQHQPEWSESNYHLFVVMVNNRDEFIKYMNLNDINPGLHYPVPCHLQKAYSHLNYKNGVMPNSEKLAQNCVSLPIYAELEENEISKVIDVVNSWDN